jgi:2-phospho-L-lactate guanylyltransferase (CobY/MobA/RfbA family)
MLYQITEIEFDFDDSFDEPITEDYKQGICDLVYDNIWEVNEEEDLADAITDATGWCIKSIDYKQC